MNNMNDTEKGQDVDLNLVEIDSDSSVADQNNNLFKFITLIFIVIVVAFIGFMVYKEVNKEIAFRSIDGILSVNASRSWIKGTIEEETEGTYSMPVLYLIKNDNQLRPSEFLVMRIVSDISNSDNVDEVYEYWKDSYKYNELFNLNRLRLDRNNRLKLDRSGKLIPDSADNIQIGGYEARQIEFDEKDILDINYSHFLTIVKVDNKYYEVSGITLRAKLLSYTMVSGLTANNFLPILPSQLHI